MIPRARSSEPFTLRLPPKGCIDCLYLAPVRPRERNWCAHEVFFGWLEHRMKCGGIGRVKR